MQALSRAGIGMSDGLEVLCGWAEREWPEGRGEIKGHDG